MSGMITKYVHYEFNAARWSQAMNAASVEHGMDVIAELMDVSIAAIRNWSQGHFTEGFRHPNMTNFLKFCNLVEIEPAEFFTTSD